MTVPFTRGVLVGLLISIPLWFAVVAAVAWWLTQ